MPPRKEKTPKGVEQEEFDQEEFDQEETDQGQGQDKAAKEKAAKEKAEKEKADNCKSKIDDREEASVDHHDEVERKGELQHLVEAHQDFVEAFTSSICT
jgi:hypothetical protein